MPQKTNMVLSSTPFFFQNSNRRWGITNKEALAEGKAGVECRGYEHEVSLVWSIASGKRLIIDDGNEVHYSIGRRGEGKFQHSWTGCNSHVLTIVAFASPPLNNSRPGFKQFDLLIDGMSYDSFPRIFELGTMCGRNNTSMSTSRAVTINSARSARSASSNAHGFAYTEGRSDRESRRPNHDQWARGPPHALESESNMDAAFAYHGHKRTSEHVSYSHATADQQPTAPVEIQDLLSTPNISLLDMESPSQEYANPYWDQPNLSPSSGVTDQSHNYSPNQPPSYEAVLGTIMNAYDSTDHDVAPVHNTTIATVTTLPDVSNLQINTTTSLSTDDLAKQSGISVDSPRDVADIDGILKNLVNLDDISSSTMKGYSKERFEKEQKEKSRTKSLHELKRMQNSSSPTTLGQTKEIMKTHEQLQPVTTNPSALVVYGLPQSQQTQSYNNYPYSAPAMHSAY